jgi:DnaJ like chaperone protein
MMDFAHPYLYRNERLLVLGTFLPLVEWDAVAPVSAAPPGSLSIGYLDHIALQQTVSKDHLLLQRTKTTVGVHDVTVGESGRRGYARDQSHRPLDIMSIWGKILGGAAGFAIGGPIGALLGAVAGHAVDLYREEEIEPEAGSTAGDAVGKDATQQVAFTIGVIVLGAKMAKVDGAVTRHEVNAFKQVFHIPQDEMKNVGRIFDLARRDAQGWEPYAKQIAKLLADRPAVLEELLDGLFHIARADGALHDAEIEYLHGIARVFGFSEPDFERIRACNGCSRKNDAYAVLGLTPSATDEEIKVTYRQLVRDHHPDRLIAQGLPQDFIDIANDKLAAINAAHDRIRKERGAVPEPA